MFLVAGIDVPQIFDAATLIICDPVEFHVTVEVLAFGDKTPPVEVQLKVNPLCEAVE